MHRRDGYCYAFNVWLIYDGISRIVIYILRFCLYAAFCCRLIAFIPEGGVRSVCADQCPPGSRDRLSRKVKMYKKKKIKIKKGGPSANGLSGQVPWLVLQKCMNVLKIVQQHQKLHSDRSVKSKRYFQTSRSNLTNICYSRAGKYSFSVYNKPQTQFLPTNFKFISAKFFFFFFTKYSERGLTVQSFCGMHEIQSTISREVLKESVVHFCQSRCTEILDT